MPKLATTVNNLELTSNKITSGTPSSSWTDSHYVSGQTLYEAYNSLKTAITNAHPVGCVVCMSTNTNPAATLGGTWTLIDKDFTHTWLTLSSSNWTATNAAFSAGHIALYGKTMMVRLCIVPSVNITDSTITLGKLNLSSLGFPGTYFGMNYKTSQSDGGQASVVYTFGTDGTITSYDALNISGDHLYEASAGSGFYVQEYLTFPPANMPDKYCNRFYFKRTA